MSNFLPLIVGFGGFNAAGRSSGHRAYQRMIYDTLDQSSKASVRHSLASLMGRTIDEEQSILNGTLVRQIESSLFDAQQVPYHQPVALSGQGGQGISFELSARQMPAEVPAHWQVESSEGAKKYRITVNDSLSGSLALSSGLSVTTAGQLPSGFDPASYYRSAHHPRGLSLAVLAASDAINSVGIPWAQLLTQVSADQVSTYCSSAMSQMDGNANGGLLQARAAGRRVTSKQLAFGFNSMPADFVNAYVLGSLGATGAVAGACASFLYNLRSAVNDIRSGKSKIAVVGVSEAPVLPEIIEGYAAMGALASDEDLRKLDGTDEIDHRRASRPFAENCGFTIAESGQFLVLMAPDLALKVGAQIYGAVPEVYVNADGYKKSISSPGAGNYLTMAKAVGLTRTLLGEKALQEHSFVQAHGSSTPQNRVTESHILDTVARGFDIQDWPVAAVKSYLGHSIGAASGDQMAACLGIFKHGVLPGTLTIDKPADDVYAERLSIENQHIELDQAKVGFLNSKGFGGNNATAAVFSPAVAEKYLSQNYSKSEMLDYQRKLEGVSSQAESYLNKADAGKLDVEYHFGADLVDEKRIDIHAGSLQIPGWERAIKLDNDEGYSGF